MADRPLRLEYRGSRAPEIRQAARREGILFYVSPLYPWHDSVFWICFLLGSALSTLVFSEDLLEAIRSDRSSVWVLALLLAFSWGLCAWLAVKASVGINPSWSLLVRSSCLSFQSRAAWKAMDGTWDRSQIVELFVGQAGDEPARWVEFGLRLQDGTKVGLVLVDKAHSHEALVEMAAEISRRVDLPVQVKLPSPKPIR